MTSKNASLLNFGHASLTKILKREEDHSARPKRNLLSEEQLQESRQQCRESRNLKRQSLPNHRLKRLKQLASRQVSRVSRTKALSRKLCLLYQYLEYLNKLVSRLLKARRESSVRLKKGRLTHLHLAIANLVSSYLLASILFSLLDKDSFPSIASSQAATRLVRAWLGL